MYKLYRFPLQEDHFSSSSILNPGEEIRFASSPEASRSAGTLFLSTAYNILRMTTIGTCAKFPSHKRPRRVHHAKSRRKMRVVATAAATVTYFRELDF